MGDNFWVVELSIKPGELGNFRALMSEMVVAIAANEPGTLNYELFMSEDGSTCHIYERYADMQPPSGIIWRTLGKALPIGLRLRWK